MSRGGHAAGYGGSIVECLPVDRGDGDIGVARELFHGPNFADRLWRGNRTTT